MCVLCPFVSSTEYGEKDSLVLSLGCAPISASIQKTLLVQLRAYVAIDMTNEVLTRRSHVRGSSIFCSVFSYKNAEVNSCSCSFSSVLELSILLRPEHSIHTCYLLSPCRIYPAASKSVSTPMKKTFRRGIAKRTERVEWNIRASSTKENMNLRTASCIAVSAINSTSNTTEPSD